MSDFDIIEDLEREKERMRARIAALEGEGPGSVRDRVSSSLARLAHQDLRTAEAEVARLREAVVARNQDMDALRQERDDLRALLRPFLKFSWTAADKEAVRWYFAALGKET